MAEEKIIGIDLGTTNSVVAVMEGKEVKVIASMGDGDRLVRGDRPAPVAPHYVVEPDEVLDVQGFVEAKLCVVNLDHLLDLADVDAALGSHLIESLLDRVGRPEARHGEIESQRRPPPILHCANKLWLARSLKRNAASA